MKFTVYERIMAPEFLPAKASYSTAIVIEDLKRKLRLSQSEMDEVGLNEVISNGVVSFNWKKEFENKEFEIELTKREKQILENSIKSHDERGTLPVDTRAIMFYEKFFPREVET